MTLQHKGHTERAIKYGKREVPEERMRRKSEVLWDIESHISRLSWWRPDKLLTHAVGSWGFSGHDP
jgi:transposase